MALILLSGRPGVGKTEFCHWLASQHGFIHVETDLAGATWGPSLCVRSLQEAHATYDRAQALGPNVIIEWGFPIAYLSCVRQLRAAGFDAWWLDGEEVAARQGYIKRWGRSLEALDAYFTQVAAIQTVWSELERFYGNHIICAVTAGPTYLPFAEIASTMLGDVNG